MFSENILIEKLHFRMESMARNAMEISQAICEWEHRLGIKSEIPDC